MRSLTPITSSMSLEIIKHGDAAIGEPAASARRSPFLAPTSMPRVGSSKIITLGFIESHLASTTFCWLPPGERADGGADRRRLDAERAACWRSAPPASASRLTSDGGGVGREIGQRDVLGHREVEHAGRSACDPPARDRCRCRWHRAASRSARGRPSSRSSPPSMRSMPNTARASSVRPDADQAGQARESRRARTSRLTPLIWIGGGAHVLDARAPARRAAPPAECRAISGRVRSSAGSWRRGGSRRAASSPTARPSRSTTTRSAQCSTSFRRCEMKMTADPASALRSAMTSSRRSVSLTVRLEVGSSMITMRASSDSALAISTSWRCASDRFAHHGAWAEIGAEAAEQRLHPLAAGRWCQPASAVRPRAARGRSARWRRRRDCRTG